MAKTGDFYVTVRSMDSMDYFSSNTASDFNVRLPQMLVLDDRWKVCVNEIWIGKQWFNLTDAWIRISVDESSFEEYNLKSGYYEDNMSVLQELNKVTAFVGLDCATFTLDRFSQRVSIETLPNVRLKLSENICKLIGHKYGQIISSGWEGVKSMDIHADYRILMVCTDFISEQLFSDDVASVVKMIDSSYQYYGEVVHDNVVSNYVNVRKNTFDTIHVQIKTESGKVLKCEAGSCIIQFKFSCTS